MSTQVVLTLSADLYERAKQGAALTRRDVPQTLTDALEIALTPLLEPPAGEPPVTSMSDGEVVALAQVQMVPQQGKRLACKTAGGSANRGRTVRAPGTHAEVSSALDSPVRSVG